MKAVRVIVEFRGPQVPVRGGHVDVNRTDFDALFWNQTVGPIPCLAASRQLQMSLDAAKHHLFLMAGSVDASDVEDLRRKPNVVNIYRDNKLGPFSDSKVWSSHSDWLKIPGTGTHTDCPIPPCDCTSWVPHGSLAEVAIYLGANEIWQDGVAGEHVVVGVVDGGITALGVADPLAPGLVPRVIGGWPVSNWGTIARWHRHANMLATDILGLAPQASIYDVRISDSSPNGGLISDAIAGVHWTLERFRQDGTPQILVVGCGIHQQCCDPVYATNADHPFTRKIVEAMDEGILVLFAAGNAGQACPCAHCGKDIGPGKGIWGANGHPRVMTVGAVNMDEQLIGYSSQGPAALDEHKPDFCGISHFQGYFPCDNGTSAACATAAGVVALLKQARPTLTQEAIKRLLKSTAKDIGPPSWDRHSGSGIIQAKAAYDALIGRQAVRPADMAQLQKLEVENRHLKELFVELALEKRMRTSQSNENS